MVLVVLKLHNASSTDALSKNYIYMNVMLCYVTLHIVTLKHEVDLYVLEVIGLRI